MYFCNLPQTGCTTVMQRAKYFTPSVERVNTLSTILTQFTDAMESSPNFALSSTSLNLRLQFRSFHRIRKCPFLELRLQCQHTRRRWRHFRDQHLERASCESKSDACCNSSPTRHRMAEDLNLRPISLCM